MHYYILEAAILGSSHVCFFILFILGSACAQASAMMVPQGLLTLACSVSPFGSARDGRQDTATSLRSLNTEKENN